MSFNIQRNAFTLIELLIAITIVGILTSIALPSYQNYTRRAHYTELLHAVAPYKIGVAECYQVTGGLKECIGGSNGIPADTTLGQGAGLVKSIIVKSGGKIVATPNEKYGIKSTDKYELAPTIENNHLTWKSDGEGVKKGYAR